VFFPFYSLCFSRHLPLLRDSPPPSRCQFSFSLNLFLKPVRVP
jgi:hypothetical protein